MPIDLPDLDDRRFDDLVSEGRQLISAFAPSWTDHNTSDPGVTFFELFASTAEMLMYRVNRVSEANKQAFVRLLKPDWKSTPGLTIDQELSLAVRFVRTEERAVTAADFERLAKLANPTRITRVKCITNKDLSSATPLEPKLGHISLIVEAALGTEWSKVAESVQNYFKTRCTLATQLHIVQPSPLRIGIRVRLHPVPHQLARVVKARALAKLIAYFDPINGGPDQSGWPVGRSVYRSDIYAQLDQVDGVAYVTRLPDNSADLIPVATQERRIPPNADFAGLRVLENELAIFDPSASVLEIAGG